MSTKIYYNKTPIRRNCPMSPLVHRLKSVVDFVKQKGTETVVKEGRSSSIKSYIHEGITVIFDKYYEDKTMTVQGAGAVHFSMNRSESYFDIDMTAINRIERKLGIQHGSKKAA